MEYYLTFCYFQTTYFVEFKMSVLKTIGSFLSIFLKKGCRGGGELWPLFAVRAPDHPSGVELA